MRFCRKKSFPAFVWFFPFQTNQTGLLLGASGAAGVVVERSGPAVRFLPTFFALSNKEDEVAQHFAAKLLLEQTEKLGVPLSHGFADCSCYNAVASLCAQEGLNLKLHRCLQHVAWCHQDRTICAFFVSPVIIFVISLMKRLT